MKFQPKAFVAFCVSFLFYASVTKAQPISNTVADSMAERAKACVVCHGKEGRATPDGFFPRIAGKPSDYLFNQLVNFRDGRRKQPHMNHLVSQLPDAFLKDLALYFSSLDLPYAAPPTPSATARELERGKTLVLNGDSSKKIQACISCHGQTMMGMRSASPGLLGLPRDYLVAQIGAWQIGSRKAHAPDCMAQVAKQLSPSDVAAVTHWLATQPISIELSKANLQEPSQAALTCGSFK